jgi:hypothetical protein
MIGGFKTGFLFLMIASALKANFVEDWSRYYQTSHD